MLLFEVVSPSQTQLGLLLCIFDAPSAEQLIGAFHCAGVHLMEALVPHVAAIKGVLRKEQSAVDAKLEDLMLHLVQENANAALVGHLLRALGDISIEDLALAGRGMWLRVAINILDRSAVGTMLATCLPVITEGLLPMIENLSLQLLAPSTQVRRRLGLHTAIY